jgi:cytochrome d ubiquinol oxidase subunit I
VAGISCWLLWRGRNTSAATRSIKVGAIVGIIGLIMTMYTGHGSAVQVSRVQPMKLAAMEGLYNGSRGQSLIAFGLYNSEAETNPQAKPVLCEISIPYGLSFLANADFNSFVPGINDLIEGREINENGDTVKTISYAEKIAIGKAAQQALRDYQQAKDNKDEAAMAEAEQRINDNYQYFGYGFLNSPQDAIPPVGMTFYAFRIMVMLGGYLLIFFALLIYAIYRKQKLLKNKWICWLGIISIPAVWICSQAGWVVAEVGRQPWAIQDLMPVGAAVSDISSGSVQLTFWIFAIIFTLFLAAEISILLRQISKRSKEDIEIHN